MRSVEIKFLFEGIIFPSYIFMEHIANSLNCYEFTVSFVTKYLILKYRDCYFLVWENNRFKPIYTMSEKETELVQTLQNTITKFFSCISEQKVMEMVPVINVTC
jgi:hypothetical protein